MSDAFPHKLVVSFITTVAFPGLVVLCNACMLGLVVFKLRSLRHNESWKLVNTEKRKRLWKNAATVLGLSCVLGLPWALLSTTYVSVTGIYIFTVFNSLQGQSRVILSVCHRSICSFVKHKTIMTKSMFYFSSGVFMFLWSLSLTCKSHSDHNSSSKNPSTQKIMTTSFNN